MRIIDERPREDIVLVDHDALAIIVIELSDGTRFNIAEGRDGDRVMLSVNMNPTRDGAVALLVRPRAANAIWLEKDSPRMILTSAKMHNPALGSHKIIEEYNRDGDENQPT